MVGGGSTNCEEDFSGGPLPKFNPSPSKRFSFTAFAAQLNDAVNQVASGQSTQQAASLSPTAADNESAGSRSGSSSSGSTKNNVSSKNKNQKK